MNNIILIVEDEAEIAEILSAYFNRSGMRTEHATDGRRALEMHQMLKPALVLLDVQLPLLDGWQVLSAIRARGDTPGIMLTAMDQDIDKLMGLRIGADDYVVKPFNPDEVVARAQAVLRRAGPGRTAHAALRAGPLEVDLERHQAALHVDGRPTPLDLTLTEFKLLALMARSPQRVFSRAELLESCLPEGDSLERTVDSHVSKLRRKLEAGGVTSVPASVRGVGYKLGLEP
ncbi:response regulator [Rubrivivax sp. JA1029]|uniref:response regulator n=1 Tax=Rubrivivax sp. JA1029 TaxID=2894193 RepID=UPI001E34AADE|nr:response regulator [Rubrivivax sp. JA1029]MCC9645781.1 response regulator [Rubrivivax sp. JA1029]